jgi:hypothetical protein
MEQSHQDIDFWVLRDWVAILIFFEQISLNDGGKKLEQACLFKEGYIF